MASYIPLEPTVDGKPRIKITVERGYDQDTGRRLRKFKTVTLNSLSERTIKKAITEFEIEVSNMEMSKNIDSMTFNHFVEKWMDNYVRVDLTIKTRDNYNFHLKKGILDELGHYKLSKIKTFHIVECFKKWKESNGNGSMSIGKFTVLKSIFGKAIEWKVIKENPMNGVKSPRVNRKAKGFYDEEQIKVLFDRIEDININHKLKIKLAVMAGLRISEIAGIRVECIDFDKNTIIIDRALYFDEEKKQLYLGLTKNKKARTVTLPVPFMDELKLYIEEREDTKSKVGNLWKPMLDERQQAINLLFTNDFGYPHHPRSMSTAWNRIIEKKKLPKITFHDLRHSYASFMVSKGVNFKIIQEQLGHSDIKITLNVYSHLTDRDKQKASDLFDDFY
ncbi:site-specific integrase [Solibacillus sp. FSL R7-0668]|uniref:tyrosine-type recombinase/integrase n=1 Tax=Solibacillus sp. FSL R7-0668 TaxID=2921688 RepID=UPI0030F811EA